MGIRGQRTIAPERHVTCNGGKTWWRLRAQGCRGRGQRRQNHLEVEDARLDAQAARDRRVQLAQAAKLGARAGGDQSRDTRVQKWYAGRGPVLRVWQAEAAQQILDDPLEVVEVNRIARLEPLGSSARDQPGGVRPFDGCLARLRRPPHDPPYLEQPDVADPAREIAFEGVGEPRKQSRAHDLVVRRDRVLQCNGVGQLLLRPFCAHHRQCASRNEGPAHDFVQTGAGQQRACAVRGRIGVGLRAGVGADTLLVRRLAILAHAQDLLDQIFLDAQIGPEGGNRGTEAIGRHLAGNSETGKLVPRESRWIIHPGHALQVGGAQLYLGGHRWPRVAIHHAFDHAAAAQLGQKRCGPSRGKGNAVGVHAALEAIGGLGNQPQAAAGAANAAWLEGRCFEQHIPGRARDLARISAHDTGQRHRPVAIGDHDVLGQQSPVQAVKGRHGLTRPRPPDHDGSRKLVEIEGVQGMAGL